MLDRIDDLGDGNRAYFALAGTACPITAVGASGTNIELTLRSGADAPTAISDGGHAGAGAWITNANGVGVVAFTLAVV